MYFVPSFLNKLWQFTGLLPITRKNRGTEKQSSTLQYSSSTLRQEKDDRSTLRQEKYGSSTLRSEKDRSSTLSQEKDRSSTLSQGKDRSSTQSQEKDGRSARRQEKAESAPLSLQWDFKLYLLSAAILGVSVVLALKDIRHYYHVWRNEEIRQFCSNNTEGSYFFRYICIYCIHINLIPNGMSQLEWRTFLLL